MEAVLNSKDSIFEEIEQEIFNQINEELLFDEKKIKEFIANNLSKRLQEQNERQQPFLFEKIIFDFFRYMKIELTESKKTRDFGIDGIVKMNVGLFGEVNLGLQIKYKTIDSTEVDSFLSALKMSELQLGAIICKDSRELTKYELNSKLKAILFSRGISLRERLIKDKININPVFVLTFEEVISIVASNIRAFIKAVYKR